MILKKLSEKSSQILLDLFLVILGVLIAFSLNNYQVKKSEAEEKNKLLKQCKIELEKNLLEFKYAEVLYDSISSSFISQEKNLNMPIPEFRNIIINYDDNIWDVAISKGLFDPEVIHVITQMKSAKETIKVYSNRLHEFNSLILLPNLDKPKDEFYNLKTKRLKKKYSWYQDSLKKLLFGIKEMNAQVEKLDKMIQVGY